MTTQTQTTEERLSKLEGAYGQVNERFNDLTQAVREGDAALRAEMNERLRDLTQGQDALREQIRQGDANLRQVEAALRAEIRQVDSKLRSEMHRQTYLIIGVIGGLVTLLRFIG